jgi:voltage-gated potassium channel
METHPPTRRSDRWLEKRIERKGLRPRDAAYLIAAFWVIAVVVFGVVERLVDPKTFHSVWLGMWWAVETVTTVGYGDIVPNQTAGKISASFLMLGGLSLIAVVTAAITSGFVSRAEANRRAAGEDPVMRKLEEMAAELRAVKAELDHRRPETGDKGSSSTRVPGSAHEADYPLDDERAAEHGERDDRSRFSVPADPRFRSLHSPGGPVRGDRVAEQWKLEQHQHDQVEPDHGEHGGRRAQLLLLD